MRKWWKELCANIMIEKEYHKLVPISCDGGPRNSSFIRCSRTHTTKPMKTKKTPLVIQRSLLKGFRKIHAFLVPLSTIGTTNDTPDTVYGNVKSTKLDLFAVIVISPTTASKFCPSKMLRRSFSLLWMLWLDKERENWNQGGQKKERKKERKKSI